MLFFGGSGVGDAVGEGVGVLDGLFDANIPLMLATTKKAATLNTKLIVTMTVRMAVEVFIKPRWERRRYIVYPKNANTKNSVDEKPIHNQKANHPTNRQQNTKRPQA